jgi:hypothetical protein
LFSAFVSTSIYLRYETENIALYQEGVEDDLARERRFGSGSNHPDAVRSDVKSAKEEYRLLKRFAKIEDGKPLSALDADSVTSGMQWGAPIGLPRGRSTRRSCSRASRCPAFPTVTLGKVTRAEPPGWCVRS